MGSTQVTVATGQAGRLSPNMVINDSSYVPSVYAYGILPIERWILPLEAWLAFD